MKHELDDASGVALVLTHAHRVLSRNTDDDSNLTAEDLMLQTDDSNLWKKALKIWRLTCSLVENLGRPRQHAIGNRNGDLHVADVCKPTQDLLRVVIIGGGPAGLVSALETYKSGANVFVVEKRKAYTRYAPTHICAAEN